MRTPLLLASLLLVCACGASTTSAPPDQAAEDFGARLEAVLEHPERPLALEDREVMIATIRYMEDFPLDEALAPLIRPMLAWAMESRAVQVVPCAGIIPVQTGTSDEGFPGRLAMTYYMLELIAQAIEHPERPPSSDAVQLRAIAAGVRAYQSARDRIGHDVALDALATRLDANELEPFYAERNGCDPR